MRKVFVIVATAGARWVRRTILVIGGAIVLQATAAAYPVDGFIDNWNMDTAALEASFPSSDNVLPSPTLSSKHELRAPAIAKAKDSPDENTAAAGPGYFSVQSSRMQNAKLNKVILLFAGFTGIMIPFARRRYYEVKRILDIIGSIVVLSLFTPLMLIIAILIKIDSPGPVFYHQVRVGLNRRKDRDALLLPRERRGGESYGRLFTIYKFRTMRANAESKTGPVWALENDDRITRIGHILRKTRIDELPQFINVLKGDMCVIGPRPERPVFINQLNDVIPNYVKRLQVKPGITGLAQVRYQYAASIEDAKKKLRYDLVYMKKMSFSLDFGILLTTFNVVLLAKGAR